MRPHPRARACRENIRARVFHRRGNARFFGAKKTHEETRRNGPRVALRRDKREVPVNNAFIRETVPFILSRSVLRAM